MNIKDTVICRCEEVMLSEIITSIKNGAITTKEIKLKTRAGMGICQGRTCRPLVDKIISFHTKVKLSESSSMSSSKLIRPLRLSELSQHSKNL
ncbi:(2Fe-2S)-binding protein [Virgibacillus tibetensis]|uniref:(2Fe-2S)-binding protein n=1 Tax=Virgibacillus tibetensis TaxID=3042313 RepID=UPI00389AFE74